jgi:uncharacterized membrane protein
VTVVQAAIDIDAPPADVWTVLMDPEQLGEWVTIHRKLGKVSDRPLKPGSTLVQTLHLRGANFKVRWEVAHSEEGQIARWEGRGPARSHATTEYRLSGNGDGGTHFEYRNEFRAPLGPLGSAASRALMGGVPEREAKRSLQRLKALLEKR